MELEEMRTEIDRIDGEIVRLFAERMQISGQIAEYKQSHGLAILDKSREQEILTKVSEQAGVELAPYARILFNTLFELSRSYQAGKIR